MINKKNVLGKTPDELGDKDAIHVAIVSVRAGGPIAPGSRCGLNKDREAIQDTKGVGVADPFRKRHIATGDVFWLLLDQDAVPNVRHVWEHPQVDFSPPVVDARRNKAIQGVANDYGVTYEQVMAAAAFVVANKKSAPYPGSKTAAELKSVYFDSYDFWGEWSDEAGHAFYNEGTECCPERSYPECYLFEAPNA